MVLFTAAFGLAMLINAWVILNAHTDMRRGY